MSSKGDLSGEWRCMRTRNMNATHYRSRRLDRNIMRNMDGELHEVFQNDGIIVGSEIQRSY